MGSWLSSCSSTVPAPTSPVRLSTGVKLKRDLDYLLLNSQWEIDNYVVPDTPFKSSGAYGIVAKGCKRGKPPNDDSQCVLKLIRQFYGPNQKYTCGRVKKDDFIREMEIMNYIQKHILRNQFYSSQSFENLFQCSIQREYWDFIDDKRSLCAEGVIIVEHLLGGDLHSLVSEYVALEKHMSEEYLRQIFLPVFHAVKVLHDHRIVHNDIKLENLAFRDIEHCRLVLIDFGLSYQLRWSNEPQIVMPTFPTNFRTAPDTFSSTTIDPDNQALGLHVRPRNDVFSLGVSLRKIVERCGQLVNNRRHMSEHLNKLIEKMVNIHENPHFTIDDVIHSSWFTCSRDALLPAAYVHAFNRGGQTPQNKHDRILEFKRRTDAQKEIMLTALATFLKKGLWQTVNGKYVMNSIDKSKFIEHLYEESVGLEIFKSLLNVTNADDPSARTNLNGDARICYQEILLFLRSLEMFTMEQLVNFEIKLLTIEGRDKISFAVLQAALGIDSSEAMSPSSRSWVSAINSPTTIGDNEDRCSHIDGLPSPEIGELGSTSPPTATGPSLYLRQMSEGSITSGVSAMDMNILREAFQKDGLTPDQLSALYQHEAQQQGGYDDNEAVSSIIAPLFCRMYSDAPLDQQLAPSATWHQQQRANSKELHAEEEQGYRCKSKVLLSDSMPPPITLSNTDDLKTDLDCITARTCWTIVDFVVPNDPLNSSGQYGIVTLGTKGSQSGDPKHVLKIIRPFYKVSTQEIVGIVSEKDFMREYEIMKYIDEHIVSRQHNSSRALLRVVDHWVHRAYPHNNTRCVEGVFVVERLEGKDFVRYLHDVKRISEVNLRILLLRVFKALKVLHTHRIVHNDMRLENLVFRDKTHSELVIVDFGQAYQLRWPDEEQISIPTFGANGGCSSQRKDAHIVPRNDIKNMGLTLDRILNECGQVDASKQVYKSPAVLELITMMTTSPDVTIDDVLSSNWILCDSLELMPEVALPPPLDAPCFSLSNPASLAQANLQRVKFQFHQRRFKKILEHSDMIKDKEVSRIANKFKSKMMCNNGKLVIADTAFTTCLNEVNCFRPFISLISGQAADFNNDGHIDCQEILLFLRIIGIFSTLQLHRLITEILSHAQAKEFRCVNSLKSASDLSCELLDEVDRLLFLDNSGESPIMSPSHFSPRTNPLTPHIPIPRSASSYQPNFALSTEEDRSAARDHYDGATSSIELVFSASASNGRTSPYVDQPASNVANHEHASYLELEKPTTAVTTTAATTAADVPTETVQADERIDANEAAEATEETRLLK